MLRIGIMTCSNATQDLGCSAMSCLADMRKRKGAFARYPKEEELVLAGLINCPGCPTVSGAGKLIERARSLMEIKLHAVHFSYCIKTLCPFKERYQEALASRWPGVDIVMGTHEEHLSPIEFREKVETLFTQDTKSMVDVVLGKL